jgi:hypothetical protein
VATLTDVSSGGAERGGGRRARGVDTHRLTEFIYGTVTGIVALAGVGHERPTPAWWQAAAIAIVGAGAVWLAHAYSIFLAQRLTDEHALNPRDLGQGLRASWPLVAAGILLSVPLLFAGLRLCSMSTALGISRGLGITVLAVLGWCAAVGAWPRRLLLAVLSAGLGLAVVAVELAVHR